jgi:hypothetical protein
MEEDCMAGCDFANDAEVSAVFGSCSSLDSLFTAVSTGEVDATALDAVSTVLQGSYGGVDLGSIISVATAGLQGSDEAEGYPEASYTAPSYIAPVMSGSYGSAEDIGDSKGIDDSEGTGDSKGTDDSKGIDDSEDSHTAPVTSSSYSEGTPHATHHTPHAVAAASGAGSGSGSGAGAVTLTADTTSDTGTTGTAESTALLMASASTDLREWVSSHASNSDESGSGSGFAFCPDHWCFPGAAVAVGVIALLAIALVAIRRSTRSTSSTSSAIRQPAFGDSMASSMELSIDGGDSMALTPDTPYLNAARTRAQTRALPRYAADLI